jgi:hypothetical protein
MRRTSFVGALAVIALGGVLAFGIQKSPKDLDLQMTGLIIMIAGVVDLLLRFLIANSPLFSQTTADVAAVVEPVGEPVLDAFGNPITLTETPARPPLFAPAVETTQVLPVVAEPSAHPETVERQHIGPDQVVRQPGDHSTDEDLLPISPFTGHPVRTRRRHRRPR